MLIPRWFLAKLRPRNPRPTLTSADTAYLTWRTARDAHGREWADKHCL